MPPQPRRILVDRILKGTLDEKLKDWRSEGHSYATISRRLFVLGIEVSDELVRKWCLPLECGTPA